MPNTLRLCCLFLLVGLLLGGWAARAGNTSLPMAPARPASGYCTHRLGGDGCALRAFSLGTVSLPDSCPTLVDSSYYRLYDRRSLTLTPGDICRLTINTFAGTSVALWFDANNDQVFAPNEFRLLPSGGPNTVLWPVPATLPAGPVRMRLRLAGSVLTAADACKYFPTGETRDFIFTAVSAPNPQSSAPYCYPADTSQCTTGFISHVVLAGSLDYQSGCMRDAQGGNYENVFPRSTSTLGVVEAGYNYLLSVYTTQGGVVAKWVDWNQDHVFAASELVTGNMVRVPTGAAIGRTRLRIRMQAPGGTFRATDACTTFGTGETEDYTLDVLPGTNATVPAPYCPAPYTSTCQAANSSFQTLAIDRVQLAGTTLDNATGCTPNAAGYAYTNYAGIGTTTGTVYKGEAYTLWVNSLTNGSLNVSTWIDWNHNNQFEAAEWQRLAWYPLVSDGLYVTVTPPGGAVEGPTRMRIRSSSSSLTHTAAMACTTMGGGETEDYTITVAPARAVGPVANTAAPYCQPTQPGNCTGPVITRVQLTTTTLDNSSACAADSLRPGYTVFSPVGSQTAHLRRGTSYRLRVWLNRPGDVSAWLDWNHDHQFTSTEQVTVIRSYTSVAGYASVFVPRSALLGDVRLRLRSASPQSMGVTTACGALADGETEDYTLVVEPELPQLTPPPFVWARGVPATSDVVLKAVTTDAQGNVYAAGSFSGTAVLGRDTLHSYGNPNILLVRYDSQGTILWARAAGGPDDDEAQRVATDAQGNVYVTGYFSGTARFGTYWLTNNDYRGTFLAKYDATGRLLWAKGMGGSVSTGGTGLAVDARGYALVSGSFSGTSRYDTTTLYSRGAADGFVARYRPDGTWQWTRRVGGLSEDRSTSVGLRPDGTLLVGGFFTDEAVVDTARSRSPNNQYRVLSLGFEDMFLARYDTTGRLLDFRALGTGGRDVIKALAITRDGGAYVAGRIGDQLTLGANTLSPQYGTYDGFVARFDAAGNALSAGLAYADLYSYETQVALDSADNLYTADGAKYGPQGTRQWLAPILTNSNPVDASGVAVAPDGAVYLSGSFRNRIQFRSASGLITLTTQPINDFDGFLARLGPSCPVPVVAAPAVVCVGAPLTLSVPGAPASATYQWMGPNNYTSTQASIQVAAATHAQAGEYSVLFGSGGCTTLATVQVRVEDVPRTPVAIGAARCDPGTLTLRAQGAPAGGSYRWYAQATGGSPLAGATGATYTTPALATTTYYVSAASGGGCEGPRTATTATVNIVAPPTLTAGGATTVCAGGSVPLTAAGSSPGATYQFLLNGNPLSGATGPTYTATLAGSYTVRATVGACTATSATALVVTVVPLPAAPAAPGVQRCGPGSVSLTATGGPAGGSYHWYAQATGGSPIAGATGATYATPPLAATTTYYVSALTATGCEGARTAVTATVAPPPVATITPTGPTALCQGTTVTLTASAGAGYLWSTGATTASISVGTAGSYSVTVTSATGCAATSAALAVTVVPRPSAAFAYPAAGVCQGSGPALLPTVTGAAGGTFVATPAGLSLNAATGAVDPAASAAGAYTVTYAVGGTCPASQTQALTLTAPPAAPVVTAQPQATGTVLLTASSATGNQWFYNGVPVPGATGATYLVTTGTQSGAYTVVTTGPTGCASPPSAPQNVVVTATAADPAGTGLAVYPNPVPAAAAGFSVELTGVAPPLRLTLTDALGRLVLTTTVVPTATGAATAYVDTRSLSGGAYVLRVQPASGPALLRRVVLF